MKIAVALTGASGSIYAELLLDFLSAYAKNHPLEVQLVYSANAATVWKEERDNTKYEDFKKQFDYYEKNDFYAPMASGSSETSALVICPCSMGTMGRIAHGISDDLITRAADVMLKEGKKLIVVPRETPYNLIHLRNMVQLKEAGADIIPASPSFYSKPQNMEELAMTVVFRILQHLGIQTDSFQWPNK